MRKSYLLIFVLFLTANFAMAQLTLDATFRPRTEYRNGFQSLIPDAANPGFVTNTRARLGAKYTTDAYEIYINLQDVSIWGENPQIRPVDDNNSFSVFEAWAELKLGGAWSTRLGRQVLSYDDQRYYGGLDWAQQGRTHDLAMLKYRKEGVMLDVGFAYNQDLDGAGGPLFGYKNAGTEFNSGNPFQYKTMYHFYMLKKKFSDKYDASLTLSNLGFQQVNAGVPSKMRNTFTCWYAHELQAWCTFFSFQRFLPNREIC